MGFGGQPPTQQQPSVKETAWSQVTNLMLGPEGGPKKKLTLNQQFKIQEQIDTLSGKLSFHEREANNLKQQMAKL